MFSEEIVTVKTTLILIGVTKGVKGSQFWKFLDFVAVRVPKISLVDNNTGVS